MKIGLITFHDTSNFGSYLQTYGLYKKITDLGYQCDIIDYQCNSIIEREVIPTFKFTVNPRLLLIEILINRIKRKKYKNLLNLLHSTMSLTERIERSNIRTIENRYDKYFVGSDIVWGLDITKNDTTYFLDFVRNKNKKYAFASSIGNPWSNDEKQLVSPYLKEFEGIAVREDESADWIEELIDKRPHVVCDPTMLLGANEWSSLASSKYKGEKFILLYFPTKESIKAAKIYSKKYNLPIYAINYSLPIKGVKNIKPVTIADFLSLFLNSTFVFTASYHGMLFSVYFNREFSYFNRAHKSRMNTIANKLGVQDRDGNEYNVLNMQPIDYFSVNKVVENYRNFSINVLKTFLKNEQNNL
jgi:hypothetical protein